MADESIYEVPKLFSIYLYVGKESDKVEAIMGYTIFGLSNRKDSRWMPVKQTDPIIEEFINSNNYRTFEVDWSKEPIIDADPKDEAAWEHQLVAAWDAGQPLTSEDMAKYADEVTFEVSPRDPEVVKEEEAEDEEFSE
jgi:hypothetical protein